MNRLNQTITAVAIAASMLPTIVSAQAPTTTPPGVAAQVPAPSPIPTPSPTPAPLPFVSPMFSSNMVLQRNASDPIWGWANSGADIVIHVTGTGFSKVVHATVDQSGKWQASLPRLKVGGPYEILVSNSSVPGSLQTADFTNVLCGDVWLCSGQSNMQFGVGGSDGGKAEISAANYPNIRILFINNSTSPTPTPIATTKGWDAVTPDTIQADGNWNGFSAVGWYFGKGLYTDQNIPIGLIGSYVGGTPAEAWTSEDALAKSMPDIAAQIPTQLAADATKPRHSNQIPSVLFNSMINPLIPYGIKGAIWYQGESNEGRGYAYRTLLPTMIGDWRTRWDEGDFPFLIVQLAGWQATAQPGDDSSAEVREAQFLTAQNTPNCGIATAVDIGNATDIHPHDKADVGARLDDVAGELVYHEKIDSSGPTFKTMTITANQVQIDFDHVFGGLVEMDPPSFAAVQAAAPAGTSVPDPYAGPINGFAIAGADHKWYWANAQIYQKYSITLTSPNVPNPVAVRYAWGGWMPLNLYNNSALPVMPFRTDDWKLWSQP